MLTPRQRDLLLFIQSALDRTGGIAPSRDEMKAHLGFRSKSGCQRLVDGLVERGYLRRLPYRGRALEVVKRAGMPLDKTADIAALRELLDDYIGERDVFKDSIETPSGEIDDPDAAHALADMDRIIAAARAALANLGGA